VTDGIFHGQNIAVCRWGCVSLTASGSSIAVDACLHHGALTNSLYTGWAKKVDH